MAARLRPSEVKAVAALLNEPADSVEELAKDVIRKINELREGRKEYVVTLISDRIVSTPGKLQNCSVPFTRLLNSLTADSATPEPIGQPLARYFG